MAISAGKAAIMDERAGLAGRLGGGMELAHCVPDQVAPRAPRRSLMVAGVGVEPTTSGL